MVAQITPQSINSSISEKSDFFVSSLWFSILFHVCLIVGVPLAMRFLTVSKPFARPETFTLVSMPASHFKPRLPTQPPVPQISPQKKEAVKPVPKSKNSKTVPKQKNDVQQQEELSELNELLSDIPAPTEIAITGTAFKYSWYLLNVQQKVERQWNPPVENKDTPVIVSFTILKDGDISDVAITSSAGISVLDNLAVRAIKLAAPFGRLPPGYESDKLEISFTLRPIRK